MTCRAASAIQRLEAIDVAGPQNWNSGKRPSLPDFFSADEAIGLPPEPDLHEIPEQPAVGDDPAIARQEPVSNVD